MTGEDEKTYYLCQPYSYDPEKAYSRACYIVYRFLNIITIFSPILHTHHFDKRLRMDVAGFIANEIYYKWDINILNSFNPYKLEFLVDTEYPDKETVIKSVEVDKELRWTENHHIKINSVYDMLCRCGKHGG